MDLFIIEIVCWAGLLFFFWALKDGLSRVESDIEAIGILSTKKMAFRTGAIAFCKAEQAKERIGTFCDEPIFRYVTIEGRTYQFDRVFPPGTGVNLSEDERCVAPGLVYLECQKLENPAPQS